MSTEETPETLQAVPEPPKKRGRPPKSKISEINPIPEDLTPEEEEEIRNLANQVCQLWRQGMIQPTGSKRNLANSTLKLLDSLVVH